MDPRRLVILAGVVAGLCSAPGALLAAPPSDPTTPQGADTARPYLEAAESAPVQTGRRAIAAANRQARAGSPADRFEGGDLVFAWAPGRLYEVWAAPLRVTTLSLPQGEILMAKAAGDTVRWQIGEAGAGEAATAQTLVLLKPLQRGLETNLVLTTNRRIYLIHLKSGPSDGYNPAVRWAIPEPPATRTPSAAATAEPLASASIRPAAPERPLNLGYRIEPRGRRAPWTPTAVFDDGRRTFIAFPPELQVVEAPALFVIGPDGEPQFANYRQADSLFIVDRVFDQAELRLGDRRPQVVRIRRLAGGGS